MWCSDVSLALACQPADEAAHVDCWNYLCLHRSAVTPVSRLAHARDGLLRFICHVGFNFRNYGIYLKFWRLMIISWHKGINKLVEGEMRPKMCRMSLKGHAQPSSAFMSWMDVIKVSTRSEFGNVVEKSCHNCDQVIENFTIASPHLNLSVGCSE